AALSPSGSDLPVMLTMRPQRWSIMPGRMAWVSCRTRVKFSVIASSQRSSGASMGRGRLPPAQLTRMSTWPRPSRASRAMAAMDSSSMMSAVITTGAGPPIASISFARLCRRSVRRATTAVRTPSAARPFAIARPMPALAPVTRAVLSLSRRSIGLPEPRACDAGAFHEGAQLCPRNGGDDGRGAGERREAAVRAGDDVLPPDNGGVALDALGYDLRVLDEVGCGVDDAGDDDL